MRCRLCKERAIYAPLRFCKEHFLGYYRKKVMEYFESTTLRNARILVGVSGGKDSSALADALVGVKDELNLTLALFTINLEIPGYSHKGLEAAQQLAERYSLPLIVSNLKDYPRQIPDFAGAEMKPCSACGTIKRHLLNAAAIEHGYDYIATGHNLDDEFYFAMHNLMHRNVAQLQRQAKRLLPRPELRLAGRIKPLYYLTEKENRLYCLLRGVPHDADECPFSIDNPQVKFKLDFAGIGREQKKNIIKSLRQLQLPAGSSGSISEPELRACTVCGYPTSSEGECAYCRVMNRPK